MHKSRIVVVAWNIFLILSAIFLWRQYQIPRLPFESPLKMLAFSELGDEELRDRGYSGDDINVIRYFPDNFDNFQMLQTMMEEGQYRQVGYRNSTDFTPPNTQDAMEQMRADAGLKFRIQDLLVEENINQTKLRLLAEFTLPEDGRSGTCYLELRYPHFGVEEVYALARYIGEDGAVRDFMLPVQDQSYSQYFRCTLDRRRKVDGERYTLQSCVVILDVEADTMAEGIRFGAPFEAACGEISIWDKEEPYCQRKSVLVYD